MPPCKDREKAIRGHSEKMAVFKPRRGASPKTNPDGNLILDFEPPEHDKINFCCSSYLVSSILLWQPAQTNIVHMCTQRHKKTAHYIKSRVCSLARSDVHSTVDGSILGSIQIQLLNRGNVSS